MLDFSTKTSYSTRAVYELARAWNKGIEKLTLKEIVSKQNVPLDYMGRLLFKLKKGGIVTTIRGKDGGYALVKKPSEIKILDIITLMENPTKRFDCLLKEKPKNCDMFDYCMIKYVWNDAYTAMNKALSKYTFQDLVDMENKYVEAIKP